MGQNLASVHPTADTWAQVDAQIAQLVTLLAPLFAAVSPSTKKMMVKMGPGSEFFCRQSYEVMVKNLELMPRGFDLEEMRRDLDTHDALNARIVALTQLLEKARDTEMALGSDAMVAALEGYAVLKAVGKGEGVQALKKMLARRFDTSAASKDDVPAPAGG